MAESTIRLTGVADNFRTPGAYGEIIFAQGPANAALGPRTACVVGPKLATGQATVNVLYAIPDEGTAAILAGTGSPSHRVARKYLAYGGASALSGVFYTPTTGTAASKSMAIAGTPTKLGQMDVQVTDSICSFGFSTNNTASSISEGLETAINGKPWLPVTCAAYHAATGTGITITSRVHGVSPNTSVRIRTEVTPSAGMTIGAGGDLASGVGDDSSPLTTALAVIDNVRRYYIGVPVSDATLGALVKTHVVNKSLPLPGLRSVAIMGGRGTLAATTTIANGFNNARVQYVWQEDSDNDVAELVGEVMGLRSQMESSDAAVNMAGTALRLNKQYDVPDWPTPAEQSTAINEGITPIASTDAGAYLVMSVDTQSKNPAGTVNDFRATETHRVSVADFGMDTILATWSGNFQGKKLKADKLDSQGLVDPNQKYTATSVTPSMAKKMIGTILRQMEADEMLQEVDASIAALRAQRSTVNSGRIEAQVNFHAIDHAHQFVVLAKEVSAG